MLLTEYDEEKTMGYLRKEYEEDIAEARKQVSEARKEIARKDELIRTLQAELARKNHIDITDTATNTVIEERGAYSENI